MLNFMHNDTAVYLDDKYLNDSYIPTLEDVVNMTNEQRRKLISNNNEDFFSLDDFRDQPDFTAEDEEKLCALHKRYIITRKLCRKYLDKHSTLKTVELIEDLSSISYKQLEKYKSDIYINFIYSAEYDSIDSNEWSEEYQEVLDKYKNELIRIEKL